MPNVKATFTADISQFRQSLAQATTAVTAFDQTTSQVSKRLGTFANQFSGAKIQREAELIAHSITAIGGASKLTQSELQRANGVISEALAKYKSLGTDAPASVRALASELKTLTTESDKVGVSLSGIGQSLLNGIGIGAGINIAQSLGAGLREMVSLGAQLSPIRTAFDNLSGGAAQAGRKLEDMRGATRGLVSDFDLMQAANKGALLGLDAMGIDMSELAQVATRLGRAMGQDASKSVDDLTTALARQSPQILDNLGIKLNLTEANEKYARSIGKSVEALTDEEKKLAFASGAMEAARAKAAELGETSLTTADQIARIGTSLENVVARIGAFGNESGVLSGVMGVLAGRIESTVGLFDKLTDRMADAVPMVGRLSDAFGGFGGLLEATVAPGLRVINLALEGTIKTLDKVRALREWMSGTLGDVSLPTTRTADIQLSGGMSGPGSRAQAWLTAEEARLQKKYMDDQEAALRKLEEGGTKAHAATKKLTDAQRELNAETSKAFKFSRDAAQGWDEYAGNLQMARMEMDAFIDTQRLANLGPIASKNPLSGFMGGTFDISSNMTAGVLNGTKKVAAITKDWRIELQGVSQAFANLAQVGGRSLDGLNRTMGGVFASANAGLEMVRSLSGMFNGLQNEKGEPTGAGKALGGGIAGLGTGLQIGGLFTNRGKGALAGAASGAAAGGLAGGFVGAGVGALVGAFAGMFAAAANAASQRVAKDVQAGQLTAEFGGLDNLLDVVGRLGMNQGGFLKAFYGEPKEFAKAITELNQALAKEKQEADKLVKSLAEVARVQGVLSKPQLKAITNIRPGGPGSEEVVAFARQQRGQAEEGIGQAIAGLSAATSGGTANVKQFQSSIAAVTGSLSALFGAAIKDGESAISVLKRLGEPIKTMAELLKNAGQSGGDGFAQLQALSDIASGVDTGPIVELASGLGSALAGLANTGLLSPELFGNLANGIGEAYKSLELLGKGGTDAARLMQPGLQAIWQMIQGQPELRDQLDDTTKSLLEFAEENGLIGEKFRPAIDRMIDALGDLIDKIGDLVDAITGVPAIDIPVTYSPAEPGDFGQNRPDNPFPNGGDHEVALASGGVVTRPTRALIGEAGPEAVIPLSRLRGRQGGGDMTVVSQIMLDGREIARSVNRYQGDERRLVGAA